MEKPLKGVFQKINSLTFEEYETIGTSSMLTRSTDDIFTLNEASYGLVYAVVTVPVLFIGGSILAFLSDWLLALVLERACSRYAVAPFPLAKNTGLAHTFATAADRTTVRRVLGCLSIVLAVALFALGGGVLALAAGVALWRYHRVAVKQFGGITGDLAGWFLQKAELYMLAALVFCQWKGFL